jgi:hypothetical protein
VVCGFRGWEISKCWVGVFPMALELAVSGGCFKPRMKAKREEMARMGTEFVTWQRESPSLMSAAAAALTAQAPTRNALEGKKAEMAAAIAAKREEMARMGAVLHTEFVTWQRESPSLMSAAAAALTAQAPTRNALESTKAEMAAAIAAKREEMARMGAEFVTCLAETPAPVPLSFATGDSRDVDYCSLKLAETKSRRRSAFWDMYDMYDMYDAGANVTDTAALGKLVFGSGKAPHGSDFADAAHGHDLMGEFAGTEAVGAHPPAEEDQSTRASNSDDGGWHRLDAADEAEKQQALVLQPRLRHQQVPPPPKKNKQTKNKNKTKQKTRRGGGARAA